MRKRLIFLICIIILIIITFIIIFFNFKINENFEVNREWINKDEIMMDEILPLLYEMPNVNNLMENYNFINRIHPMHKRELGLGYSIINLERYGGYTSIFITVLVDENINSFDSIITIRINNDIIKLFENKFSKSSIQNSEVYYGKNYLYHIIKHKDMDLYEAFINNFNEYFQINKNIYIPDEIKNEYRLMTEPFNENVFGYRIGFDGIIPRERIALNKILELNDKNILLGIIASPNPEGRLYAIEGLSKNNINNIINDEEYLNILNKIIELNCRIRVGRYCVISFIDINSIDDIQCLFNEIRVNIDTPIE